MMRPSLYGFPTVIVLDINHDNYHTAVITAMRKAFGRYAAWSAFGYGFPQYRAVAVRASIREVKAACKGANWEDFVVIQRFRP